MRALLFVIVVLLLAFILPVFYAAALVLLESIFGESVYIHAIVFVVFLLAFLFVMYIITK